MAAALATLIALAAANSPPADAAGRAGGYRADYDEHFRKYSKRYFGVGKDWRWFKAQAIAESNLNTNAKSWVQAKGIMQIMPRTFEELQKKNPEFTDISDPRWNIAAGIYYDSMLWKRYQELEEAPSRRDFMFGAYNAGPATISRARRVAREAGQDDAQWQSVAAIAPQVPSWRHKETLGYVDKIQRYFAELQGE